MAFSTQKDFFHVPFMNENVEYECKKACVKLKSYDSSIDDRSWARDETKMSQFLSDLVTCQIPVGGLDEGNDGGHTTVMSGVTGGLSDGPSRGAAVSSSRNMYDNVSSRSAAVMEEGAGVFIGADNSLNQLDGLRAGDSLLECANLHLADYQKMMNIKVSLENQLDVSNERLKTASEENRNIKEILASRLDSNATKDFYNKIQKLIAAGKLTKNEENEMLQIHQKMENMHKAYEVLQAENTYLKRLIEKLSSRVTMDQIKIESETSKDVNYLQKEINTLRKECIMLRALEEDYHKIKQESRKRGISDQDADNIKSIIKERNSLREKCKSFKTLEKTVVELENKYKEADRVNSTMNSDLNMQENCIKDMECAMQKMQKYYEDKLQQACFREQCLKGQLEDLKDDMVNCKCQAQKAEMLQMELACLRSEVLKRDMAISEYGCQYKQLMGVVNELQAVKLHCLQDSHTQTCKNQTDDLAFFTCATLDEIRKEIKKKRHTKDEFDSEYYAYGLGPGPRDEEISRLQKEYDDMKTERDNTCADALKRLEQLEAENGNLLNENGRMRELMQEGEEKMLNMLKKIEHLDLEMNKNADELRRSSNELADTKKLVEDISNIQLENQQLANAMNAINSRDDEKIIGDLRRQLEEEMAKLKKCQFENVSLKHQAEDREIELKTLKDQINKLQRDISQLESDNRILMDDNDSLMKEVELHKNGEGYEATGKLKKDKNIHENIFNEKYNRDRDRDPKISSDGANVLTNEDAPIRGHFDNFVSRNPNEALVSVDTSVYNQNKHQKQTSKEAIALDAFIHQNAAKLQFNSNKGQGFETELRKILEDFIQECGFCFSRLANPKSKLYAICHKLNHCGITALCFRELAYMHKKIYVQAEKLVPGCLLDMILTDHMDEVQGILNMSLSAVSRLAAGGGNGSETAATNVLQKCCSCKSALCCNKSEEMLKEKVTKLENDIEIARDYLDSLKAQTDFTEIMENNDLTYRAVSPVQKISSKQFRKLKTRIMKNSDKYQF